MWSLRPPPHSGIFVSTIILCMSCFNQVPSGDTLRQDAISSLASWLLAIKSEEGYKVTFSHWPKLDTLFATQAWILLWRLPEAKASKKAVLRVRCLRSLSFIGSKGVCVSSLSTKFPLEKVCGTLGQSL